MILPDTLHCMQFHIHLLTRTKLREYNVRICWGWWSIGKNLCLFSLRNPLKVARLELMVDVKLIGRRVVRGWFRALLAFAGKLEAEDECIAVRRLSIDTCNFGEY
jgi:hypothetical protein